MSRKPREEKWYFNRFVRPVLKFLQQGMTPERLALTVAIGSMIGLSPLYGLTTLICVGVAAALRLNQAAIQVANYMVFPFQLMLIIPNIRAGEWLFGIEHFPFNLEDLRLLFRESWINGILLFGKSMLIGAAFWAIIAIPLGFLVYYILVPLFRKARARYRKHKQEKTNSMKTITTHELKKIIDNNTPIQLIDQRTSREYDNGHIDGAIHYFKDDLEAIPNTLKKDVPVIIYCIYGIKSKATAEILTNAGFDVTVLEGGIYQWKKDVDKSLFIL